MNINWVLSNKTNIDPANFTRLKELGSIWGGWRTWRKYQTDNVICHDAVKAEELIQRKFHNTCNFYIPNSVHATLGQPSGVKLYQGDFIHDVDNQEDIVAMHLATTTSDIILLLGFDFGEPETLEDRLAEHRAHNYRSLTRQVILDTPTIQWVVVTQSGKLRLDLQDLPNISQDTLENVLTLDA